MISTPSLEVFEAQWTLAAERNRPVTVHCLQAWGHLENSLTNLPRQRFLLHSYSGSQEMVRRFAELGAWFSMSPYFLRPEKALKRLVFHSVPEDRLLFETDAPEMRGPSNLDYDSELAFNHPANLKTVYEATSANPEKIRQNFERWFNGA